MITKYWTDSYGNVFSEPAQICEFEGIPLYNPRNEMLTPPPICEGGKRPDLIPDPATQSLSWSIIPIDPRHIKCADGIIRDKAPLELMRDGLEQIPLGMKVVVTQITPEHPHGLMLETQTLDERVASGSLTADQAHAIRLEICHSQRRAAYQETSDGLFFDWQRGAATQEAWLIAIDAIKARFPKPEKNS
ncbi:MAG: hypothetical protein EPN93_17540 [Spirochaetes bacterium]|nr:MAG: hypothetical protein EPN93_17540 [Spirochaetota bacterium]